MLRTCESSKWKNIIRSKSQGELGIENLKNQSKAPKVKLQWRYSQESQTLKCSVIKTKYEELDNWVSKEVTTPYVLASGDLLGLIGHSSGVSLLSRLTMATRHFFWADKWMGFVRIQVLFPDIYALAQHQHKTLEWLGDSKIDWSI